MNVLDLFSGIGGFSLGLERAGIKTVAFCEMDENCKKVLQKHWPGVPIFRDVRELHAEDITEQVDLICGGFPCTDLSNAKNGSHTGIYGKQSSLVFEFGRIVTEIQPRWIVIENVTRIKKYKPQLAEIFKDYVLSYNDTDSADYGALCRRKRTYIIGHHRAYGGQQAFIEPPSNRQAGEDGAGIDHLPMLLPWKGGASLERLASCIVSSAKTDTIRVREGARIPSRVGDGVLYLMLGNSLCPSIPEAIGRAIMEVEGWLLRGGDD